MGNQNEKNLEQVLLADQSLHFIKRDLKTYGWEGFDFFNKLYDLEKIRCGIYHTFLEPDKNILDNLEKYRNLLFECYNNAYERFLELQAVERKYNGRDR